MSSPSDETMSRNSSQNASSPTFDISFESLQRDILQSIHMKSAASIAFHLSYGFISFVGTIGNFFVCIIVGKNKSMRSPLNILIANLSLANLITSIALVPLVCIPEVRAVWTYGRAACKLTKILFPMNYYCASFTITAISVDRYLAVNRIGPKIKGLSKPIEAMFLAFGLWILALILALPELPYITWKEHIYKNRPLMHLCFIEAPKTVEYAIIGQQFALLYLCPFLFVMVFNYKLHRFLKQQRSKRKNLQKKPVNGEKPANVPVINVCSVEETAPVDSPVDMGSLRHVASSYLMKKTSHLTSSKRSSSSLGIRNWNKTSILLFSMAASYCFLWLPFIMIQVLQELLFHNVEIRRYSNASSQLIGSISVAINPFLYGYLNTNFRREFRKFLNMSVSPERGNKEVTVHSCHNSFLPSPSRQQCSRLYEHTNTGFLEENGIINNQTLSGTRLCIRSSRSMLSLPTAVLLDDEETLPGDVFL